MAGRVRRGAALSFVEREPAQPQGVSGFNAAQWAIDHEKRDDERFGMVFRILGAAGLALVSLLVWSLKTQYDSMALAQHNAEAQLVAIQSLQSHLAK